MIVYLVDSFRELQRLYPAQHRFEQAEPVLTLSISQHANLQNRKEAAGLSGAFSAESYAPVRDSYGRVHKNGRTDILFTLGQLGAPQIIFEFKKLDGNKRHRDLYISDGLNRFVTGKYAPDRDQGVMVGLTKCTTTSESASLQQAINNPTVMAAQCCIPNSAGFATRCPSEIAPGAADFDSVHDRDGATMVTPINVAHVFITCT